MGTEPADDTVQKAEGCSSKSILRSTAWGENAAKRASMPLTALDFGDGTQHLSVVFQAAIGRADGPR